MDFSLIFSLDGQLRRGFWGEVWMLRDDFVFLWSCFCCLAADNLAEARESALSEFRAQFSRLLFHMRCGKAGVSAHEISAAPKNFRRD